MLNPLSYPVITARLFVITGDFTFMSDLAVCFFIVVNRESFAVLGNVG